MLLREQEVLTHQLHGIFKIILMFHDIIVCYTS